MATTFENNTLTDVMLDRKSIRVYDETVKIPQLEMLEMIQEATTAPSSVNMQPWRFVVVESPEAKETLKPLIRFNVRQNDTSAAMLLIFGDMECYELGETIYDQAVAEGKMPQEVRDQQLDAIIPYYKNLSKQEMNDIVKIDSSLAAMQFMLVARAHGYDTNPIGGFEKDQLAEAFGMDKDRYVPVMILSVGKAAEAGYQSVRLDAETITNFK
ncbi:MULTISPECIES: nitroreductase family protein [unclassified Exiguobacterium]|uniref:nitroreductase family protein n=1 Tax=unclassified Exiguobacterium TaxID=2644629 RepID=UPI00103C2D64|nr:MULTISPECIES: nitroreductase family protein [unclassified Exiguobacterium]TCI45963.1 nitroreductase family protein [Exiguobacterium sp. SH5S32]TCI51720.1 nitroreductase family protein [Exiguobacterium sp. SH1S4]TCI53763.1 nitroreductase family protein [Exiguobacterium sp. SH1S21]TCI71706.1 nitroreductase family protein [Exiguobacterium sp. SH1S1]TCI79845.1 nitroreductase family protein [Exiguobacterium sp. SH0S1]